MIKHLTFKGVWIISAFIVGWAGGMTLDILKTATASPQVSAQCLESTNSTFMQQ